MVSHDGVQRIVGTGATWAHLLELRADAGVLKYPRVASMRREFVRARATLGDEILSIQALVYSPRCELMCSAHPPLGETLCDPAPLS